MWNTFFSLVNQTTPKHDNNASLRYKQTTRSSTFFRQGNKGREFPSGGGVVNSVHSRSLEDKTLSHPCHGGTEHVGIPPTRPTLHALKARAGEEFPSCIINPPRSRIRNGFHRWRGQGRRQPPSCLKPPSKRTKPNQTKHKPN